MTAATHSLTLFGEIELQGPAGPETELLLQSKVVALLALLSVPTDQRFVRRDSLVGMLWPELDQSRARAALRKTVHGIRARLGADALVGRGDEELALSREHVTTDVAEFTRATDDGFLLRGLELYRGELMPGFHLAECAEFDRWLEEARTDARERASAAAWALASQFESDSQLSAATGMARRAVRFSWSDERSLRRALGMLDRLGDRAGAARLYDEFERRLRAEFDMTPSPETIELIGRIRGPVRRNG
jgi:DNA-binding SARP family transcriptional activator